MVEVPIIVGHGDMTTSTINTADQTLADRARCPRCGYDLRGAIETWADQCPPIQPGPGRVVLSTVTHLNGYVYELRFEDSDEVLYPTRRHRLFSEDRQDWVATGQLEVGEKLRTADGSVTIRSIDRLPGVHRVYNIEVNTNHSFYVSVANVLSHNYNPCGNKGPRGYRYNEKNFPTRKRAKDAARRDGAKRPDHDGTPTGPGHFHPVDINGKRIPGCHYKHP